MADADDWAAEVEAQETTASSGNRIVDKVQGLHISQLPASKPPPSGDVPAAPNSVETDDLSAEDASLLRKLVRNKLVPTSADIEVTRKDPNSPLYSVKTFESLNLKPELLTGIYDMGFNAPSKIQETALPALLADPPVNMIAQSQSGTGKTAAFVLTMLSRVDISRPYTQCLCVAPTYELALQIGQVTRQMAKHVPEIGIGYAVRGEILTRGQKTTDQIVIGTPGKVFDWCMRQRIMDPKQIDVFVLDEADVMISTQGHQEQCMRIHRELRKDCQILFFSATYEKDVMEFAHKIVPDPMTIRLRREEESLDNIKQYYIVCSGPDEKFEALGNIYGAISIGQSMIFCHSRKIASWLSEKMTKEGHAVALLSGELAIEQRAAVIQRFRDGKEKVLITTNVTARGIDVEQVTVVVNFDLPVTVDRQADCETYLHRIGRTGRFGKNGIAINMVDGSRSMKILEEIEKHFGRPIEHLRADDTEHIEKIAT